MDKRKKTLYLVLISAFTAVTAIATALIAIPGFTGTGYLNFGDAVIFVASVILGPLGGAVVGGLGSAIADLFVMPVYAPFTLVVKGVEGFLCGFLYHKAFGKMKYEFLSRILSMIIAGAWMVVGYILSDWIILMVSGANPMDAMATATMSNVVTGSIQAGVSVLIAVIVSPKKMGEIFDFNGKDGQK